MTEGDGGGANGAPGLIVLLDTNVFHGDVYLNRQPLTTLLDASDQNLVEGMEIWTPLGVVEELVRQFPERVARMKRYSGQSDTT